MGGVLACRLRLALPPRFLPGVGRGWGQGAGLYHSVGGGGDRGRGCPTQWAGPETGGGVVPLHGRGSPTQWAGPGTGGRALPLGVPGPLRLLCNTWQPRSSGRTPTQTQQRCGWLPFPPGSPQHIPDGWEKGNYPCTHTAPLSSRSHSDQGEVYHGPWPSPHSLPPSWASPLHPWPPGNKGTITLSFQALRTQVLAAQVQMWKGHC